MNDDTSDTQLGRRIALGTVWVVGSRLTVRALGMISTLVLVRLLVPEDFGLVAIGITMMQLLTNLTEMGVAQAIIKYRNSSRDFLDTLFTLSVLRGLLTGTMLVIASFFAVSLFSEPKAQWVLLCLAPVPVLQGLLNPKFHEFERDLDFSKTFQLQAISKVLSVATAVVVALITRNYWAIIASLSVAALVETVLSYLMRPYRPRLTLKASADQFKFLGWMTGFSFLTALNHKLDALLLPRLTSTVVTGLYYLGYQLVDLATVEISMPVSTALFPGMSEKQDDPEGMRRLFLQGVEALAAISLPLAFGLSFVASDIVLLLAGEKWLGVVPVLQIGAPIEGLLVMMIGIQGYAIARDRTQLIFIREFIYFLVRTPLFIWAALHYGLMGAILGASIGSLVKWLVCLGVYQQTSGSPWWEPVWQIRRSVLSIAAMALWFWGLMPLLVDNSQWPLIGRLALDVASCALVYLGTHYIVWHLEGRPDGVERSTFSVLSEARQRFSRTA